MMMAFGISPSPFELASFQRGWKGRASPKLLGRAQVMMKHVGTAGIPPLWRNAVGDSPTTSWKVRLKVPEADIEANVRYAPIRDTQEKHRALNAPALQIAVRGFSKRRAEGADEVRL
jgi:hypothetical protein